MHDYMFVFVCEYLCLSVNFANFINFEMLGLPTLNINIFIANISLMVLV